MHKILVSGCLVGERVRYHGGDARADHPILARWLEEGRIVTACPEVLGGLATPRPPAEIVPGSSLQVVTREGVDVTAEFERGASATSEIAEQHDIRIAILKTRSPSCGNTFVYDGTFSGKLVPGDGVATRLLRERGIAIFGEDQLEAADAYLATLSSAG